MYVYIHSEVCTVLWPVESEMMVTVPGTVDINTWSHDLGWHAQSFVYARKH